MTGVLNFLKTIIYVSGGAFSLFILALCGIGLLRVAKRLQIWLRDDAENARHVHELMVVSEEKKRREAMAVGMLPLARNEQGMIGGFVFLAEGGPTFIDGDTQVALVTDGKVAAMIAEHITPLRQQVQEMRFLLAAYAGRSGGAAALPNIELPKLPLPEQYSVTDLLSRERPDIDAIPLGIMSTEDGRQVDVRVPFSTMIHFVVIGTSGAGKSSLLRALALYLWKADALCYFIDMKGLSFQEWREAGLDYPIATEPEQVIAIVKAIHDEQDRRQAVLAEAQVQTMWAYNKTYPDRAMRPMAVFVDEWTRLQEIDSEPFHHMLDRIVSMGRSSGVAFFAGGTSIDKESMPTSTKNNFATRACMAADPVASRILLAKDIASTIMHQGRAYVRLPGETARALGVPLAIPVEMQMLYVGEDAPVFQELGLGIPPANDLVIEGEVVEKRRRGIKYTEADFQRTFNELRQGDLPPSAGDMCFRLTGHRGGNTLDRIKKWMREEIGQ